jgi:hypothetical protein
VGCVEAHAQHESPGGSSPEFFYSVIGGLKQLNLGSVHGHSRLLEVNSGFKQLMLQGRMLLRSYKGIVGWQVRTYPSAL